MNALRDAINRTWRVRDYLRLRPFDTSSAEGRYAERYRRIAWSTIAGLAARLTAVAVSLATIPLALGHLGPEQYGLWVTISAVTSMLVFADFGLGNGLMNAIADAYGRDDRATAQRAISSAFFMLIAIAAAATAILLAIYGSVPWAELLNVTGDSAAAEAGPTVLVFFLSFAVSLPLGLVQRIQYGYQEGYEASVWAALGSFLSLGGLIVAIQAEARLPIIVLALVGGPVVATALNAVVVFVRRHPDLRPRLSLATPSAARQLVKVGLLFFVLQLAVALAFQSDVVVATRVLGPSAAAEYSVTFRLFFLVPTVLSMLYLPLWPAYAEAIARGDVDWIRRTLLRTTLLGTVLASLSSIVLLVVARYVLDLWLGHIFAPPFMLLFGMAIWAVQSTAFTSISMLLNGATVIRFQVIIASIMAVSSIGASIALASQFGISGIVWGTLIAHLVCSALPTLWYLPRLFKVLAVRAI